LHVGKKYDDDDMYSKSFNNCLVVELATRVHIFI